MKATLLMVFASYLFVGIFSESVNANEYCSSGVKALEMFQNMSADLTNQGYELTLTPKTCAVVVEVSKEGESFNHGLANITWKIKTIATVYYVWTGEHYQFLDFVKLYTQTKAPMGDWSTTTYTREGWKQKSDVRTMFTFKYFFAQGK